MGAYTASLSIESCAKIWLKPGTSARVVSAQWNDSGLRRSGKGPMSLVS